MNLAHLLQATTFMTSALDGTMTFSQLEHDLLSMAMDIDHAREPFLDAQIGAALLVLAEMDRGDRSAASVRDALNAIIAETQANVALAESRFSPR
jgi:hypothetical protein